MKTIICNLPAWLKVFLYFVLLTAARFVADAVPALNDLSFYLSVSLLLSWLLLWAEGKTLKTLNFIPVCSSNWLQLLCGTVGGILMLIVTAMITVYLTGDQWHFNSSPDIMFLLMCFLANLWSVFVQEFAFRGYPFQTLNSHYGAWKAQLIIAIPFGLMHVNSTMDMQTILMAMLTTGLGSVLFGMAYLYTRNLALPIGLHVGWNYAQALIPRTAGAAGRTIITVDGDPKHYSSLYIIGPYLGVVLCTMAVLWLLKQRMRISTVPLTSSPQSI